MQGQNIAYVIQTIVLHFICGPKNNSIYITVYATVKRSSNEQRGSVNSTVVAAGCRFDSPALLVHMCPDVRTAVNSFLKKGRYLKHLLLQPMK